MCVCMCVCVPFPDCVCVCACVCVLVCACVFDALVAIHLPQETGSRRSEAAARRVFFILKFSLLHV